MAGNFFEKDNGWTKFTTQFEVNAGEASAFIGFLRSSGTYQNEESQKKSGAAKEAITLAQLAATMVYGSSDGRIPSRDFMGSAIKANGAAIEKLIKKLAIQIIAGKMTRENALGIVGQFCADKMKAKIVEGVPPPNAASTIKKKGSSKPLIDSSQMMNAIDWEVKSSKSTKGKSR